MIKAAQSQTQTRSDVEACINIRDEKQNLVWPIYSPLKASSRKPKYSPTLGGLGLNMPLLETWLSAQEMKIDVLLVLDAEFNTRHFLCLCWMLGQYWVRREPTNSSAFTVLLHYRSIADTFLLHSTPRQSAGFTVLFS